MEYLDNEFAQVNQELAKIRADRDSTLNGPGGVNQMKQQTAILGNEKMSEDQRLRMIEKDFLENEVRHLQTKHQELTHTIREANAYRSGAY